MTRTQKTPIISSEILLCTLLAVTATGCSSPASDVIPDASAEVTQDASTIPLASINATLLAAEVSCISGACDIQLSESEGPTRFHARGRAHAGQALVFDGFDRDTLYWASSTSVTRLDTGRYRDFSRPVQGKVWVASENSLRQIDQQGNVWQEISEFPQILSTTFVDEVGGTLIWGGLDEELRRSAVWLWKEGVWTQIALENASVDEVVALSDEHALFLGYGNYYLWTKGEVGLDKRGGSDDLFDKAVRCSPTEYWAGGLTGMAQHCDVAGICSFAGESTFYDFQQESIGCVDQGLVSYIEGTLRRTEPDGSTSSTPAPNLRHTWADLDVQWTVSSPE